MDLEDAGCRTRFLIRDRDGKLPDVFDAVLADVGIQMMLTGRGITNARPLKSLPSPITESDEIAQLNLNLRRSQRLGVILNESRHAALTCANEVSASTARGSGRRPGLAACKRCSSWLLSVVIPGVRCLPFWLLAGTSWLSPFPILPAPRPRSWLRDSRRRPRRQLGTRRSR